MYLSQRGKSCYQEQLLQDLLDKNEACRRSHIVTMVCKSLHNLAPDYLRAKIVDRDSVTSYALGDMVNKLAVPQPRTNYLKNTVKSHIKGLGLYNQGPRSIFEIGGGGEGAPLVPHYWGRGTRHFLLLTLYNFKNIGVCAPPPPTPRSLITS